MLAKTIQRVYEFTDYFGDFVEHPRDFEVYDYLLDIDKHELETISDSEERNDS
jgi:hypothetical protein